MSVEFVAVILAGLLGVAGTTIGVLLTGWLTRSSERRRLSAEDERRWLTDRRVVFSAFLVLSQSMLRDIDGVAAFLDYEGTGEVSTEDDGFIQEGLGEYFARWDDEMQTALSQVQLIAGESVSDLADRMSGALMEITAVVEMRGPFVDFYPTWFRAQDLLGVLRNAMRAEIGVARPLDTSLPRTPDWPWLSDRPTEVDYIRRQTEIPGRDPLSDRE